MTGEITSPAASFPSVDKGKDSCRQAGGITTILLPEKNRNDVERFPHPSRGLRFVYVKDILQVFKQVFADGRAKRHSQE